MKQFEELLRFSGQRERLSKVQRPHYEGVNSQMLTQVYIMDYNVPIECCWVVLKCLKAMTYRRSEGHT